MKTFHTRWEIWDHHCRTLDIETRGFPGPLEALEYVVQRYGREFVNEHFTCLAAIEDVGIVWLDDTHGLSLENHPVSV